MERIIGIMGGTFNPIHLGHIQIAVKAHEQFNIPHILVMPSGQPSSYKDTSLVVDASHRCAMIELSIKEYPYMSLSTMEIERTGPTFTSDTLKILKNSYDYIYFLIGADSLYALETWHDPEYVMTNCHILAANRDNHTKTQLDNRIEYLKKTYNANISLISMDNVYISSSDIRQRIKQHLPVNNMLNKEAEQYILDNHLYC